MKYLNTKPGSIEEVAASMSKYAAESEYQDMFKKELEKAGKGIGSMTPAEKKAFFNKIDSKYTAKNEETINENASQVQVKRDGKGNFNLTFKGKEIGYYHKSGSKYMVYYDNEDGDYNQSDEVSSEMQAKKLAYDNMNEEVKEQKDNAYAIGMAAAMKAKNDQPPLKKSTITKAHDIAKSIEKDQKEEVSQKEIDKFHTSLDKLVHKSFGHSSDEKKKEMKKETHSFVTNKMNQAKKDAPGEKQVVDPEPKLKEPKAKMSFKEAYKKVKEAMNTVGDATADRANQMVGQDDKKKDPDIKKPKATTDAGTKATPIDTSPEVEYKN